MASNHVGPSRLALPRKCQLPVRNDEEVCRRSWLGLCADNLGAPHNRLVAFRARRVASTVVHRTQETARSEARLPAEELQRKAPCTGSHSNQETSRSSHGRFASTVPVGQKSRRKARKEGPATTFLSTAGTGSQACTQKGWRHAPDHQRQSSGRQQQVRGVHHDGRLRLNLPDTGKPEQPTEAVTGRGRQSRPMDPGRPCAASLLRHLRHRARRCQRVISPPAAATLKTPPEGSLRA